MPLTEQVIRNILLDELRARGYAPNPADVVSSASKIMAIHKAEVDTIAETQKEADLAAVENLAKGSGVAVPVTPPTTVEEPPTA